MRTRREPTHCTECGMLLNDAGEYHPYSFCVWKKAGLVPWETLKRLCGQLGMGEPPHRPLVRDLDWPERVAS